MSPLIFGAAITVMQRTLLSPLIIYYYDHRKLFLYISYLPLDYKLLKGRNYILFIFVTCGTALNYDDPGTVQQEDIDKELRRYQDLKVHSLAKYPFPC